MSQTSIHLITPPVADSSSFKPKLEAAIKVTGAASVHLKFTETDPRLIEKALQVLAPVVTDAGAALLIDPPEDLREIARWGVDGVHIIEAEAIKPGLAALKPDRIVGVSGLRSKDAAMSAGEEGCDYVMFGEPRADGSLPPLEQVVERCQWWVEIFNTPCIGYASGPEAVAAIAETGVEFVAFGPWAFEGTEAEIAARLASIKAKL